MRERRRRHDDAHMPLGGKGKRATRKHYSPPSAVLVPDTLITDDAMQKKDLQSLLRRYWEARWRAEAALNAEAAAFLDRLEQVLDAVRIMMKNQDRRPNEEKVYDAVRVAADDCRAMAERLRGDA